MAKTYVFSKPSGVLVEEEVSPGVKKPIAASDTASAYFQGEDLCINVGANCIVAIKTGDSVKIGDTTHTTLAAAAVGLAGLFKKGGSTGEGVQPAPIGAALMKTGQTTSYCTGDDGDLESGREVDFFTLSATNPFGNNKRFTGTTGGYQGGGSYFDKDGISTTSSLAIPNNIVIDWSTYNGTNVLGYYRLLSASNTYAIGNTFCVGLTAGSYSGWRMANLEELINIAIKNLATTFGYNPFNFPSVGAVFSSTTVSAANTYSITNNYFQVGFTLTAGSAYVVPVRLFIVTGTTLT